MRHYLADFRPERINDRFRTKVLASGGPSRARTDPNLQAPFRCIVRPTKLGKPPRPGLLSNFPPFSTGHAPKQRRFEQLQPPATLLFDCSSHALFKVFASGIQLSDLGTCCCTRAFKHQICPLKCCFDRNSLRISRGDTHRLSFLYVSLRLAPTARRQNLRPQGHLTLPTLRMSS